ncbi:MAG: hypothetical protein Q4G62_00145 [Pseudomonadota bacterium]|nr:hypothetical protein [Pseudomonadota bacterium]
MLESDFADGDDGRGGPLWGCPIVLIPGPPMPNLIIAILLILIALPAANAVNATELRKCALADGRHLYINRDCPAGSRELWQRAIVTVESDDDDLRRRREDNARWQQMNREEISAGLRARPGQVSGRRQQQSSVNRCQQARQRRDQIRQRDFMRMDYQRMLALDRQVADACR